jgi:hypothetical protein
MYEVMSVTKAVIGLVYTQRGSVTEEEAGLLNMQYREDWDDDLTFKEFRDKVENGGSLLEFAQLRLHKQDQFSYCNLAYQLLASRYPNLPQDFGKLIGRPQTARDAKWAYGNGWKWEISKSGEVLGPHGLHITDEVGMLIGEVAKSLFVDVKPVNTGEGWGGIGAGMLNRYYRGWFFRGDGAFFAIGLVAQIIGVHGDKVSVSFREQDWDSYDNWKEDAYSTGNAFVSNMSDIIIKF